MATLQYFEKSEYNNPKSLYAVPISERKKRFFQLLKETESETTSSQRRDKIMENMRGVSR